MRLIENVGYALGVLGSHQPPAWQFCRNTCRAASNKTNTFKANEVQAIT